MANEEKFKKYVHEGRVTPSRSAFKIKLFLKKGENSLLIARQLKERTPKRDDPGRIYYDYWTITIAYYSMLYCAKALILMKGYEVHDHDAAHIALSHLCVPGQIEREDLELLDQSYRIFEEEYVSYFADAKRESHIARYAAIKTYSARRVEEIYTNAKRFVTKIGLLLQEK